MAWGHAMVADNTVRRIDLPSGGWWELETRPRVRDVLEIQESQELDHPEYRALAILSRGWSPTAKGKGRKVDLDAVLDIRVDDLMPVMEVFTSEVVPFLERLQANVTPKASSSPSNGNRTSRRATAR